MSVTENIITKLGRSECCVNGSETPPGKLVKTAGKRRANKNAVETADEDLRKRTDNFTLLRELLRFLPAGKSGRWEDSARKTPGFYASVFLTGLAPNFHELCSVIEYFNGAP